MLHQTHARSMLHRCTARSKADARSMLHQCTARSMLHETFFEAGREAVDMVGIAALQCGSQDRQPLSWLRTLHVFQAVALYVATRRS